MSEETIFALKNNNLLKDTNFEGLNIARNIGSLKSANIGDIVYNVGDSADSVYLVLNGEINLIKIGKNGKSQSVVFTENDFFGAKELFAKIDRCTTTVSLTESYLVELTKKEIEYLIEQDDKISLNIQKGNKDFKFEDSVISIVEGANKDFELEEVELSDKEINDLLTFVEFESELIKERNFVKGNKISNIDDKCIIESIENEKKNGYNCIINENNKIEETAMSEENNIDNKFMSHEQFKMVVKSLQLLNANVKKDDVLNNIVDVAINLTNADRGTLYLVDRDTNEIWSKVLMGDNVTEIRLKIGDGISGWVAENGELLNIPDVKQDNRFDPSFDKETGYVTRSMLVYPIKNKTNETVGVLQLINSLKGTFTEQDEVFLNAISLNAALALENASLVEQLVHSERDTSLGKMGNFLTHDLRKPILVCKRYAEHLLKKELDFDVKQIVKMLDEQLDQVANQISSASDFTEGTTLLRKQAVNLNDTLYDFSSRIRNFVKSYNCKIEHELGEDHKVNMDIKEFYQCYFNIIKNSCEALPEGGNILISTGVRDTNVEIQFNDKGIGIENIDLKNIFDPLWTKNKKNNSGLGLSIAKKIVGDHGGNIRVESNEESGTTVFIELPIHK